MSIAVTPKTLPAAGVDTVNITIEETYQVDGIGEDTVVLKGTLVGERTTPLLGFGEFTNSWEKSTVVAKFSKLNLYGESKVFGPVLVSLDDSVPSFGVVSAGKCAASLPISVSMPNHNIVLKSEEPVQLRSEVQTVPPIGDEKTESVLPVRLIHAQTMRPMGHLVKAKVAWRDLTHQTVSLQKDRIALNLDSPTGKEDYSKLTSKVDERIADLRKQLVSLLQELDALKGKNDYE
jgi:hypothetical protein